jgi:hypothetical protein
VCLRLLGAKQHADAQRLGCLGFSATSFGAAGGVSIDLTGRTLFASKRIFGKLSPTTTRCMCSMTASSAACMRFSPSPRGAAVGKRKRLAPSEEMMAEVLPGQLQPPCDPPADVVSELRRGVFDARTMGGKLARLHSYAAAGEALLGGAGGPDVGNFLRWDRAHICLDQTCSQWSFSHRPRLPAAPLPLSPQARWAAPHPWARTATRRPASRRGVLTWVS